jgi:PTH1 family peptidyl-tRNA hydrolase
MNRFLNFLTPTTRSRENETLVDAYLIVGLGNPGPDYEQTRHNAGFMTVDLLAKELGVKYWKNECGAQSGKAKYHGHDVVLAKPQGFMNTSGGPVKKLCESYNINPEQLIIIHDELDIEPAHIRVKFGGGHAGHNGLRSICDKLGTRDWYRIRVGIGRPPGRMQVSDYVLSHTKKDALEELNHACQLAAEASLKLIDEGLEKTQQEFN